MPRVRRKPSLRGAINAQCKQCVYDPMAGGTWREQVADCRGFTCPLYPVRPHPTVKKVGNEAV
jgi:hypothetical protein